MTSEHNLLAFNTARNAMSHDIFDICMTLIMLKASYTSLADDGICHRMRIMLLKAGSDTQHFIRILAVKADNRYYMRL